MSDSLSLMKFSSDTSSCSVSRLSFICISVCWTFISRVGCWCDHLLMPSRDVRMGTTRARMIWLSVQSLAENSRKAQILQGKAEPDAASRRTVVRFVRVTTSYR